MTVITIVFSNFFDCIYVTTAKLYQYFQAYNVDSTLIMLCNICNIKHDWIVYLFNPTVGETIL